VSTAELYYKINISENCPGGIEIPIGINITYNGFAFLTDTFSIVVTDPGSIVENKNLPAKFALLQNYPNPFNTSTTISYQLPESSKVELVIYTLTGQKLTTLVSERQPAGTYRVEWDATAFESGVYYYKIKAGDNVQMKKLILLK